MLTGDQQPDAAELPALAATLLAEAQEQFQPERAALDAEVERMEAELRAFKLQIAVETLGKLP